MSSSVGMDARTSRAGFGDSVCRQHHQNTALALRMSDSPRWFLSMSRSRALTPPSIGLFVLGSGPSAARVGSR